MTQNPYEKLKKLRYSKPQGKQQAIKINRRNKQFFDSNASPKVVISAIGTLLTKLCQCQTPV